MLLTPVTFALSRFRFKKLAVSVRLMLLTLVTFALSRFRLKKQAVSVRLLHVVNILNLSLIFLYFNSNWIILFWSVSCYCVYHVFARYFIDLKKKLSIYVSDSFQSCHMKPRLAMLY